MVGNGLEVNQVKTNLPEFIESKVKNFRNRDDDELDIYNNIQGVSTEEYQDKFMNINHNEANNLLETINKQSLQILYNNLEENN